jgi:pimeloyl-ACP methyl ester carboxylesterase
MVTATTFTDHLEDGVSWREAGRPAGPTAVFVHGLGGRRDNWDPQLSSLGDARRCCAVDLPGYGCSGGRPDSLPEVASWVASWITRLTEGPVDLVGLSFGGMVAQHLALDHPHLVRSLALLDTSPAFGLDGITTPEGWLASRIDAIRDPDPSSPSVEAVVAGLVGTDASDAVRSLMVESMKAVPQATLEAACTALIGHDTRDRLHEIAVPVLVMVGEQDTETPPSYAEAIASRIDRARLVVVPGAGHLLNLEAPEVVNDLLRGHWHPIEETA